MSEPKQTKAAFIRSQPATMSAADVVKKAKEAGMKLSVAMVYVTRSKAKQRAAKGKPEAKPSKPAAGGGSDLHAAIAKLAWTHGFPAVEAAIKSLKSKVGV